MIAGSSGSFKDLIDDLKKARIFEFFRLKMC